MTPPTSLWGPRTMEVRYLRVCSNVGAPTMRQPEVLIHPCPELSFFLQLPELIVEFQTSLPLYMTLFCQYLPAFSHRKPLFMLQSPSPLQSFPWYFCQLITFLKISYWKHHVKYKLHLLITTNKQLALPIRLWVPLWQEPPSICHYTPCLYYNMLFSTQALG